MRWRPGKGKPTDKGDDTPPFDTQHLERIRDGIDEKLKRRGLTRAER